MKFAFKAFLYIGLLLLGVGLFVNLVIHTGVGNIFDALQRFSLFGFLVFWFVYLTNFMVLVWRWEYILKHFHKKKVSFWRLALHRFAGWAISFLTPSAQVGGDPIRVVLLAEEGVAYKDAVFSVVVDKAVQVTGLSLFGLAGFVWLLSQHLMSDGVFGTISITLVAISIFLGWFYYSSIKENLGFFSSFLRLFRLHKIKRFQKKYNEILIVEEAIRTFHTDHWKRFVGLVILSIAMEAYEMVEFWIVGYFMGFEFTLSQTFLIKALPNLTYLLPIPGALGVLENGHAVIFGILGIPINVVAYALIIRIRDFMNVLIGLVHLSSRGISAVRKYFVSKFGKGYFREKFPKLFG